MEPRIVAGVPTHRRTRAPVVAKLLARVGHPVYIIAKDCPEMEKPDDSRIQVIEQESGDLMEARNRIIELAKLHGADWVMECDDDLSYPPEVLDHMLAMTHYPWLGAICSQPNRFYYWSRDHRAELEGESVPWLFTPSPTQLWMLRIQTVNEIGPFKLQTMEDIEWGLRAWDAGWGIAKVHVDQDLTHTPVIGRTTKTEDQGGHLPEVRDALLPGSVEYINDTYGGGVVKWMKLSKPGSKRTYDVRYGWDEMYRRLTYRWGEIGYRDTKGKSA